MADDLKRYRVFIASPGGLPEERTAFRDVITHYNEMDAMERGVVFTPIGWEITLGGVGRPQSLINEEIKKCDYFVLLLWDRWGSRPDLPGKGEFSSGTEEEYRLALKCLGDDASPLRQIIVFFKAVDPRQINDPGPQLKAVLDFKTELENSKNLLFHTFDEVRSFERWIERYLACWVRDHEDGDGGSPAMPPVAPLVPTGLLNEFSDAARSELPDKTPASSSSPNAALLDHAEVLTNEGRISEAESSFAQAIVAGNDPEAFNRYGHFLARLGRLDQARIMYERVLVLAEAAGSEIWKAKAYGNLGLIYRTRDELDRAEEILRKAHAMFEKLGDQEQMAAGHANLGLVAKDRDEVERARELLTKALDLYARMGMPQRVKQVQRWLDELPQGGTAK